MIDDAFLSAFVSCPACLGTLVEADDERVGRHLACARCSSLYPFVHGVPDLTDVRILMRLPLDLLAAWRETQARAAPLYEANDPASCSTGDRADVQEFRRFMSLSGKTVLDVGSGSFALPGYADGRGFYADGRGFSQFVGIDPIGPTRPPPFPFVVGLAERLPFADETFDCIVFATSLDHALDVDTALAEARRVLRPEGDVYFWGMFVEDEEQLGADIRAPVVARGGVDSTPAVDAVAAHLELRRAYTEALTEQRGTEERIPLVDDFHFRHLNRDRVAAAFARNRFVLASEHAYTNAHGGVQTFMRFAKATPEDIVAATVSGALAAELDRQMAPLMERLPPAAELADELQARMLATADTVAARFEDETARIRGEIERASLTAAEARRGVERELHAVAERLARIEENELASLRVAREVRALHARVARRVATARRHARRAALGGVHAATIAPVVARALVGGARNGSRRGGRILMLTISQVDHDPRISKVARSLARRGYTVDVLAPGSAGRVVEDEVYPGVTYIRVPRDPKWKLFLVFQDEYRRAARARSFDYVHANDLTTLTVAWTIARERHVPLVYDAHELWAENVQYSNGGWVPMSGRTRAAARGLERFLLRYVDVVISVSPSIVAELQRRYRLRRAPVLLPNYPSLALLDAPANERSIREECGFQDEHFVTLYLGGVNPLRNIENVIAALAHLPEYHVFVVRGPGVEYYAREYEAVARAHGVQNRVFFLDPVPIDDVIAGAAGADCGIVMLRNICKNFYFFYPNKLFEYALAGLPIAVSAFPDVRAFVERERCGVTFDPDDPASIAGALGWLGDHRDEARAMGERGRAAIIAGRNWEVAVESLVSVYDELR